MLAGRVGHTPGTRAACRTDTPIRYRTSIAEKVATLSGSPQSTRQGSRALRRREKPDSSARSHATGPADEKGRAQTMTHDYKRNGTTTLLAAARCEDRRGLGILPRHRAQGIHPFPEKDQPGRGQAPRRACDLRQLQDPQDQGGAGLARQTCRASSCASANIVALGRPGRRAVRRNTPASKCTAAYSESVAELEPAIETWLTAAQRQAEALQVDRRSQYHPARRCTCQARAGRRPRGGYMNASVP